MQQRHSLASPDVLDMEESYFIQLEDELFGKDWPHSFATKIFDAKYKFADVIDVVKRQDHLTQGQWYAFLSVLQKHQQVFYGKLGNYPCKKLHQ
eukprot:15329831-Ditylum_brightwellii.AAC.1